MATNTLRPTFLRTGVSTNVAATVITPTPDTGNSVQNNQTVYEWADYSSQWKTNPPFLKGSAGTTLDSIHMQGGGASPRILRGFIRRAQYAINDDASMSRLYFMYNPEQISRDYVNYLDQGALDPFNTVFQSGNLVAPPSILDFNFELFFDRQEEAQNINNRGVMVDMDYFDLVVRNVKPGGTVGSNALPDNGLMMVNPRDITVVFSPEITVQGRPLNASVTYERFTHKMVPTRMRIRLQMRVVYFGPQRDITTFVPEQVRALESIPYPVTDPKRYQFSYTQLTFDASNEIPGVNAPATSDGSTTTDGETTPASFGNLHDVEVPAGEEAQYIRLNMEAAAHGEEKATANNLQYDAEGGRMSLWKSGDCSSFVWASFAELGLSQSLGWEKWGSGWCANTANMYDSFASASHGRRLWGWDEGGDFPNGGQFDKAFATMTSGDILLRHKNRHYTGSAKGHVALVWKVDKTAKTVTYIHAASPSADFTTGTLSGSRDGSFNYGFRPYPHR